ncbi:MAG: tetratricopeptide repeat protein [Burkholderiales bacterium]
MRSNALAFAILLAASLPAPAIEQEETFTGIAPDEGQLDPALLAELVRKGDIRAINNVGLLWAQGYQGRQSYQEALRWWREAADRGYTVSMNNIGLLYAHGHGVEQDMQQAFEWWHQSAFLGNAWAMNSVGDCYENGDGVQQDLVMAMTWYRSAAEHGDRMAMFNIGAMIEHGKGVPQDYADALSWYRKSAQAGDASAMRAIARFHHEGLGVSVDLVEAYAWHGVAELRFPPEEATEAEANRRELQALAVQLSPEQIERGKTRIEELETLTRPPEPEPGKPPGAGEVRT